MTTSLRHVELAARDAAMAFVGRYCICDVGVSARGRPSVVFWLLSDSAAALAAIDAWARQAGVPARAAIAPRRARPHGGRP